MIRPLLSIILVAMTFMAVAQQLTLQERLGYSKDSRLLIIHADDLGVSHSENMASIEVMEKGVVNSASIMVPCPWFPEIAEYARTHPDADLGLHLTLTAEWKFYKWRPVTPYDQVPSLLDAQGYFNEGTAELVKNGKAEEVEKEIRGQIERAIQFGVKPTHFDAHMAGLFSTPDFMQVLLKLGREYKVPVMITPQLDQAFGLNLKSMLVDKDVVIDNVIMAAEADYKKGMSNFYTEQIKGLTPGVSIILLHAAYDDAEMKAVTVDHAAYGAAWRQEDVKFFTSDKCKKLLADQKIKLITWKEIRDKLVR